MTVTAQVLPDIEVFSRPGCHLCEVLLEDLQPMVRGVLDIVVRNIDAREDWQARYGSLIPVVVYNHRQVCHHKLDRQAISDIVAGRLDADRVLPR